MPLMSPSSSVSHCVCNVLSRPNPHAGTGCHVLFEAGFWETGGRPVWWLVKCWLIQLVQLPLVRLLWAGN